MTPLTRKKQVVNAFRGRLVVALLAVLACFGLLGARFYHLQVVQHDYFYSRAEGNRIALQPIVPNRGIITDRKGRVLARNYMAYTLEIIPSQVANLEDTIDELARIVPIDADDRRRFQRRLAASKAIDSVPLRLRLNDEEVARLTARRYRLQGVEVRARFFREYPLGSRAAHVVGYIGRINERDVERIEESGKMANYRGSDYIGKSGLELSYEDELHGKTGFEQVEVNASGRPMRNLSRTPAVAGNDLSLTLDIELQRVAEEAFGKRRGALVAIEPATGGVLALVSMPTYEPSLFVDGISVADWRALSDSPDHPMQNRALYSAFPPGSTFKPFMALAGLESGRRTLTQRFNGQGVFNFVGHRYVDRKRSCQSGVSMHRSLVYSCNTYYYQLANDLGIEALTDFISHFGFGRRSGIDVPGEAPGILPTPEWKRQRFKNPQQQQWFGGETLSVGIGHGYSAYTPLQVANALAALVNDGNIFRPHVVGHVVDSQTGERRPIEQEPLYRIPVKSEYLDAVRAAMADVTRIGTAARAFRGARYTSGGKTGTAQVFSLRRGQRYDARRVAERLRDHSWYIGFAPADKPVIALAVMVENGGFGGTAAAPIARQVLDYYMVGQHAEGPAAEDDDRAAAALEQ